MEKIGFYKADILIPKKNLENWSVVACDQFTSNFNYWKEVEDTVGEFPSAYKIVFPEVYLNEKKIKEKIKLINKEMRNYLEKNIFKEYKNSMIYVERTLSDGEKRKGIIGALDLEEYDFKENSKSLIRSTEKTIIERIPPRLKIREDAILEIPHTLLLINDKRKNVIEYFSKKKKELEKIYEFFLMKDGGKIEGYLLKEDDIKKVQENISILKSEIEIKNSDKRKPFLFAVGDGNHSLATAKIFYEDLKKKIGKEKAKKDCSRFCLVELNNLYDSSLKFEAIHRVIFDVDKDLFINRLRKYCNKEAKKGIKPQKFKIFRDLEEIEFEIKDPFHKLVLGNIEMFLEEDIKNNGGKVDYIHGKKELKRLAATGGIGIFLEVIDKEELFEIIRLEGSLPKKSFSMGKAKDKRYYLESRKIK